MHRERLKGNTDDDEVAEQPAEKIKLEEVENKANDHVGQQVTAYFDGPSTEKFYLSKTANGNDIFYYDCLVDSPTGLKEIFYDSFSGFHELESSTKGLSLCDLIAFTNVANSCRLLFFISGLSCSLWVLVERWD